MKKFCILFAALIVFQSLCFVLMTKMYVNSDYKRFEIKQLGSFRADQYMIDHKTGTVWQIYVKPNGERYWGEMKRINLTNFDWEDYDKEKEQ